MTRLLPFAWITLSLAPAPSAFAAPQPVLDAGRSAYFSLIAKDQTRHFYNRLASSRYQFVATAASVPGAVQSAYLRAKPGERLVLVELQPKHGKLPPRLVGELARFDSFAVVSQPAAADLHTLQGDVTLYGEELQRKEVQVPAPKERSPLEPKLNFAAPASRVSSDRSFLETRVRQLSGDLPVTIGGTELTLTERRIEENKVNARSWLRQEYEALGYTVTEQPYDGRGANFIAERAGSDPSHVLLVTSHLDSVGNAGADDNAAGTISALGVAKALAASPLKYTLRFVAFDEEEVGLVGSAAYAQQLQDSGELDRVLGVINMEMTGYNAADDGAFHIIDCQENTSAELSAKFRQIAERDTALRLKAVDACTSRSDHASFWRFGKPAVVFSQNFFGGDGNPCYHRSCDKVDRMNFDYMTRMTTLLARATAELVAH